MLTLAPVGKLVDSHAVGLGCVRIVADDAQRVGPVRRQTPPIFGVVGVLSVVLAAEEVVSWVTSCAKPGARTN